MFRVAMTMFALFGFFLRVAVGSPFSPVLGLRWCVRAGSSLVFGGSAFSWGGCCTNSSHTVTVLGTVQLTVPVLVFPSRRKLQIE